MSFPCNKSARYTYTPVWRTEKPIGAQSIDSSVPCSTESHHEEPSRRRLSGPTGSVSLSPSIGHINHIANDAAPLFIYSPSFSLSHPLLFLTTVSSSCLEPLDIRRKCAARRLRLVTALPSSFDRSTRKYPNVLFAMSSRNRIITLLNRSYLNRFLKKKKYPSSTFSSILSIIPNVDSSNWNFDFTNSAFIHTVSLGQRFMTSSFCEWPSWKITVA